MEPDPNPPRMSFQERMDLMWLPDDPSKPSAHRLMSRQPAWKAGEGLMMRGLSNKPDALGRRSFPGAFGGHVYAQAPLAGAIVAAKADEGNDVKGKLGIHSIQGVFSNPSHSDRPFIYEVSSIFASRSFSTYTIIARQPTEPSTNPTGPYPISDAELPLGNPAFTCLTTFKRPVEGPAEFQETPSPQERYADILSSRAPDKWEHCPQADIDLIREANPVKGHGAFPILDMYKVDMASFNKGKPLPERRQLILYRSYKPLPADDPNAHIVAHAFEADRNGLTMLGNELGYGHNLGPTASLSYSFYVHVNPEEAMMKGDGWWVQEVWWPRITAGRGMQETKLWSPEGKHIASGYQDGMILPAKGGKSKI